MNIMRLTTLHVVLSVTLMIWECRARIKAPEPDPYSHLDNVALEILATCYENRGTAIGVVGDTSDHLVKSLLSRKSIGVTLVSPTEYRYGEIKMTYRHPIHPHKLPIFVMTSSPPEYNLAWKHMWQIIMSIWRSNWWNHQASFIVIMKFERGCTQSKMMFALMWSVGITNVNLICDNAKTSYVPYLITYNPYTSWAPKPWSPASSFRIGSRATKCHVFVRTYQNNKAMCAGLDFEKTQDLEGSEVIVDREIEYDHFEAEERSVAVEHSLQDNHIIYTILRALNATHKVVWINRYNAHYIIPIKGISSETYPIGKHNAVDITLSYPYLYIGSALMSNFRGHKTQLEKILGVIDRGSQIATCVTLLLTVIFFKFFAGQDLPQAFLNVHRAVCNSGFLHVPEGSPFRIFLATILMFTVIMQGIFQGDLATLLTTTVPHRNIDSMQDLAELASNVYVTVRHHNAMPTLENFKGSIIVIKSDDIYTQYLDKDTSGVYIDVPHFAMYWGEGRHMSDQTFRVLAYGRRYQEDFPLDIRVNKILQRMFEAGIVKPFALIVKETSLSDPQFRYDEDVLANKNISVMTLKNLAFAFVILGIGLTCATIVLIGEMVVRRVRSRKRTERVRPFS